MRLAEWQVKTVCQFIGAQAQIEYKGNRNPLVEMATNIDIFAGRTQEDQELERIRGPRVADRIEDDPRFAPIPAQPDKGVEASNAEGSYEAFQAMFGGAQLPAAPQPAAEPAPDALLWSEQEVPQGLPSQNGDGS